MRSCDAAMVSVLSTSNSIVLLNQEFQGFLGDKIDLLEPVIVNYCELQDSITEMKYILVRLYEQFGYKLAYSYEGTELADEQARLN